MKKTVCGRSFFPKTLCFTNSQHVPQGDSKPNYINKPKRGPYSPPKSPNPAIRPKDDPHMRLAYTLSPCKRTTKNSNACGEHEDRDCPLPISAKPLLVTQTRLDNELCRGPGLMSSWHRSCLQVSGSFQPHRAVQGWPSPRFNKEMDHGGDWRRFELTRFISLQSWAIHLAHEIHRHVLVSRSRLTRSNIHEIPAFCARIPSTDIASISYGTLYDGKCWVTHYKP